jgi:hypothetical protein
VRTEDPWEANMFYVPALTYFYSGGCHTLSAAPLGHMLRCLCQRALE